jgi:2-succinyl-5-enolpyruvyl-6-hydroxy-3-cyclohexene-1-carboxylate synthase
MSAPPSVPGIEPPSPPDVAATFCATLVDEWVRCGVTHAVVCPGSRSTPMALALAADDRLSLSIHHDERSAGFVAVGLGRATGRPALLLTTSGTAAVELHAAVVEASHAGVPLLALTANRPPELRGIGAPQTIDQHELYGTSSRAFVDPGVAEWEQRATWRGTAQAAFAAAMGTRRGPVQVDLAFREPLLGQPLDLPPADTTETDPPPAAAIETTALPDGVGAELQRMVADAAGRVVILAGESTSGAPDVLALAARLGAPVLADPRSGCAGPTVVTHADALVRAPAWAAAHAPGLVVRVGDLPASKELGRWLEQHRCPHVLIDPDSLGVDPRRETTLTVSASAASVMAVLEPLVPRPSAESGPWIGSWRRADDTAAAIVAHACADEAALTEPQVARTVMAAVPAGTAIVVSSSMPIRDIEWFAPRRGDVAVFANRGANGIDGVTSTAVGVALSGRRTVVLVGDLAFAHDSSALIALAGRPVDLTIVVIDNDGGGIFSFLPQAHALDSFQFERLFGTPHATDPVKLAGAHGLRASRVSTATELAAALQQAGVAVVVVTTDREQNVAVHRSLNAAIVAALDPPSA